MLKKDDREQQMVYYQVNISFSFCMNILFWSARRQELARTRARRLRRPWWQKYQKCVRLRSLSFTLSLILPDSRWSRRMEPKRACDGYVTFHVWRSSAKGTPSGIRILNAKLYVSFSWVLLVSSTRCFFLDKAGDRICMFGFSRGAYTARALAGMIHKVLSLLL